MLTNIIATIDIYRTLTNQLYGIVKAIEIRCGYQVRSFLPDFVNIIHSYYKTGLWLPVAKSIFIFIFIRYRENVTGNLVSVEYVLSALRIIIQHWLVVQCGTVGTWSVKHCCRPKRFIVYILTRMVSPPSHPSPRNACVRSARGRCNSKFRAHTDNAAGCRVGTAVHCGSRRGRVRSSRLLLSRAPRLFSRRRRCPTVEFPRRHVFFRGWPRERCRPGRTHAVAVNRWREYPM